MAESTHKVPTVQIFKGSNPTPHTTPLKLYNIHSPPSIPGPGLITLRTPPKTDLWRKPPALNVSTAPTVYTTIPLSKFRSAKVTASAKWNTLYDQGGLSLFLGPPPGQPGQTKGQWVKSGIEFVFEKPHVGTVATDVWSDWSLVDVTSEPGPEGEIPVTIEIEREVNGDGKKEASLWVYRTDEKTGERKGVREVTWVFEEDTPVGKEEGRKGTELWIGIYTARPTVPSGKGREDEELEVQFKDFEIRLFN